MKIVIIYHPLLEYFSRFQNLRYGLFNNNIYPYLTQTDIILSLNLELINTFNWDIIHFSTWCWAVNFGRYRFLYLNILLRESTFYLSASNIHNSIILQITHILECGNVIAQGKLANQLQVGTDTWVSMWTRCSAWTRESDNC